MAASNKLHITQVKSEIGRCASQRKTLAALGLGKIGRSNDIVDNDATRGMIFKVKHLVSVEEVK